MQHQQRKARDPSPARRRKRKCTFDMMSKEPPLAVVKMSGFHIFQHFAPTTMLTFGAQVSTLFPPRPIDEGCGDALRAWFGGGGFVHAACALRISTATSGSLTNVIDLGIFGPTTCSRKVLSNHRALEMLCRAGSLVSNIDSKCG